MTSTATIKPTTINLENLHPSKQNPRKHFDEAALKELAESIKARGVLQPILVRPEIRPGQFEIVCGERRYRAARLAGLKEIPAISQDLADKDVLEIMVIENLQRDGLHPMEEAQGYEALMKKHGYKGAEQIAAKIGKSRAYVYGRMKLLDLTETSRKLFYDGKLTASTALLVARIPVWLQDKAAKAILETWNKTPMSYREASTYLQEHFMLQLKSSVFDPKDASLLPKAGSCTACPKRTGNQKELFEDVTSADVCTDPKCFQEKKDAAYVKATSPAMARGNTVVPKAKAEKILPSWNEGDLAHGSGFVKLSTKIDGDKKGRTYAQLAEDLDPKDIHVAVDSKGRAHRLLLESKANEILKANGFKVVERSGSNTMTPEQKEKERLKKLSGEAAASAAIEKILTESRKAPVETVLRLAVRVLIHQLDNYHEGLDTILERHVLKYSKDLAEITTRMNLEQLKELVAELVLHGDQWEEYAGKFSDELTLAASFFKLDLKELLKTSTEKALAEKKRTKADADKNSSSNKKPFNPALK